MKFKKLLASMLVAVMILSAGGGLAPNFADDDDITDCDVSNDGENIVYITPKVGEYVNIDANYKDEKPEDYEFGTATTATELQNPVGGKDNYLANGYIKVVVDNDIKNILSNGTDYSGEASRNSTIVVSYNGIPEIDRIYSDVAPAGRTREYYVKKTDTLIFKAEPKNENITDEDVQFVIGYKQGEDTTVPEANTYRGRTLYACGSTDSSACLVNLANAKNDSATGDEFYSPYHELYIRAKERTEDFQDYEKVNGTKDLNMKNCGGIYRFDTIGDNGYLQDYNHSFGINSLTGKVYLIDPERFEQTHSKYLTQSVNYYMNFITSSDVVKYGTSYALTQNVPDRAGMMVYNQPIKTTEDFEVQFRAYFGNTADGKYKENGQGIVFFLVPNNNVIIGDDGRNLGYNSKIDDSIDNILKKSSIAIEFDTQYNKPNFNEFYVDKLGNPIAGLENNQNNPYSNVDPVFPENDYHYNDRNGHAVHDNHIVLYLNSQMNIDAEYDETKESTWTIPTSPKLTAYWGRKPDGSSGHTKDEKYVPYFFEDGKYHDISIRLVSGVFLIDIDGERVAETKFTDLDPYNLKELQGVVVNGRELLKTRWTEDGNTEVDAIIAKGGVSHPIAWSMVSKEEFDAFDDSKASRLLKCFGDVDQDGHDEYFLKNYPLKDVYFGFTASTGNSDETYWAGDPMYGGHHPSIPNPPVDPASAYQSISKVSVSQGFSEPKVKLTASDEEPSVGDNWHYITVEDSPITSINKLLFESRSTLQDAREGMSDDELIDNDKYDIGEYRLGSKAVLADAILEAVNVLEDPATTREDIIKARNKLSNVFEWFKDGQVTKNNKIILKLVNAETGKVKTVNPNSTDVMTGAIYGPVGEVATAILTDTTQIYANFKKSPDKNVKFKDPVGGNIHVSTGYYFYENPLNRTKDGERINAGRKQLEKFDFSFHEGPKEINLLYRKDDRGWASNPTGDESVANWMETARESIYSWSKPDPSKPELGKIPWKTYSMYDLLDVDFSVNHENKVFLNVVRNSLAKGDEATHPINPSFVESYINYVENNTMSTYDHILKMLDNITELKNQFYHVTADGSVNEMPITPEGKNIFFNEDIGLVARFEVPSQTVLDKGTLAPKFIVEMNANDYLNFAEPQVELYKFKNESKFIDFRKSDKSLNDAVSIDAIPAADVSSHDVTLIPCDVKSKPEDGGRGYFIQAVPKDKNNVTPDAVFLMRIKTHLQVNTVSNKHNTIDKMINWYNDDKYKGTKPIDPTTDSEKINLQKYELQHVLGGFVFDDGYDVSNPNNNQKFSIERYPRWFSKTEDGANLLPPTSVIPIKIISQPFLPHSF